MENRKDMNQNVQIRKIFKRTYYGLCKSYRAI